MIRAVQSWPDDAASRYRARGYWRGELIGDIIRHWAADTPLKTAVIDGSVSWTYRELDERADRIARACVRDGITPGSRVIVQLPNVAAFLSVSLGLMRAGVIPVFTLPAHRLTEITHFAKTSEAVAYIGITHHEGFAYDALAAQVREVCPALTHAWFVDDGSFDAWAGEPAACELPAINPSDVALMQLSGGTTGLSKLIPRTHDDYLYSFRASAEICELTTDSVYMVVLPAAHNFPMSSPGTFGALWAGGTVVMCPSPSPDIAFPLIAQTRPTITGVVPPIALAWLEAAPGMQPDLSSLRMLQIGGAKLTPEVARRITPTLGVPLQQVFGMAEGLVNYTRPDDADDIVIHTQGRPISPDDEVLIVDDNGAAVPIDTPGHLLTRGPYTIRAYHNAPEANASAFTTDGYYRTGDVVSRNAAGYLTVHGRSGDHINRGGEKVSAEEIENLLLAHGQVRDAAVVSMPDVYLGERICAFVIAREPAPRATELRRWVRERGVAAFKVPDRIVFVDAFPTTGVGKTSRRDLRAALRQHLESV